MTVILENASDSDIKTLEEMGVWDVVKRTHNMRVMPSTFACKIKLTADGLRAKLKARFCIRGDKEIEFSS